MLNQNCLSYLKMKQRSGFVRLSVELMIDIDLFAADVGA